MRKSKGRGAADIGLSVLILALVAGCASANSSTNFGAHPQLQEKVRSIKTVAIMPPNIEVRQIPFSGDGGWVLMDDETAAAKQTVATLGRWAPSKAPTN